MNKYVLDLFHTLDLDQIYKMSLTSLNHDYPELSKYSPIPMHSLVRRACVFQQLALFYVERIEDYFFADEPIIPVQNTINIPTTFFTQSEINKKAQNNMDQFYNELNHEISLVDLYRHASNFALFSRIQLDISFQFYSCLISNKVNDDIDLIGNIKSVIFEKNTLNFIQDFLESLDFFIDEVFIPRYFYNKCNI